MMTYLPEIFCMTQQFPGMVRITLAQSRLLTVLLLAAHGFCAAGLLLWPGPSGLRQGLLILVLVALLRALRHEAWRQSPQAVTRVDLEGGGRLRLITRNGQRSLGVLLPGSFVAPYGVILRYRLVSGGTVRYCVVARDATHPDCNRILRVLLRHPL